MAKDFKDWKSYADFLEQLQWNRFATLTTEYHLTVNSARRLMVCFNELTHGSVVFMVIEDFRYKGGCHIHAALNVPEGIEEKELRRIWHRVSGGKVFDKSGNYICSNRASFKQRDYSLSGGAYLTKEIFINTNKDNYDFL